MPWTALDETRAADEVGHAGPDHNQLARWANNDFDFNWGWCFVHPNGSNSYDGLNKRFPKATIAGAIAAGFNSFRLGRASYSMSPTTFTTPPRIVGVPAADPRWQLSDSTMIRSDSGAVNYLIDIDSGGVSYGGLFKHLKFHGQDFNDSKNAAPFRLDNVNNCQWYEVHFGDERGPSYTTLATTILCRNSSRTGGSNNHLIVDGCVNTRTGLIRSDTANSPQVGWRIEGNVGSAQSRWTAGFGGKTPFVDIQDGQPTGWYIQGNSFEAVRNNTTPAALIYLSSTVQVDACVVKANSQERVRDTAVVILATDAANCLFETRRGEAGSGMNINGTSYTSPTAGWIGTVDARNNTMIVNNRTYTW